MPARFSAQIQNEDEVTSDQGNNGGPNGGGRLAPRPVFRPPVDPASRQAFGRPSGVQGSFVAERVRPQKYQDQSDFTPNDQLADPVLQEAFGRPFAGAESLQRHPIDAGALAAEKDGAGPDEPFCRYLEDLAGDYHRFYDSCRVLPQGDEQPTDLHTARLALCQATRQVIANGLAIIGVTAPERM